jgi:hypothetical protein
MSVTRLQAIAYTREMMDAASSARWTDAWITTTLGLVGMREWSGILGANPYYRFQQVSTTASAAGLVAYTALSTGSADTKKNFNRILGITDGNVMYQQTAFMNDPLATANVPAMLAIAPQWYDAGDSLQILPVAATTLTITVNWTPTRIDSLSADSVTIDFPEGSEVILWLEAAAMLLSKGAAENAAAQTMRAMADQERQNMYSNIARRSAHPLSLGFNDRASEWMG